MGSTCKLSNFFISSLALLSSVLPAEIEKLEFKQTCYDYSNCGTSRAKASTTCIMTRVFTNLSRLPKLRILLLDISPHEVQGLVEKPSFSLANLTHLKMPSPSDEFSLNLDMLNPLLIKELHFSFFHYWSPTVELSKLTEHLNKVHNFVNLRSFALGPVCIEGKDEEEPKFNQVLNKILENCRYLRKFKIILIKDGRHLWLNLNLEKEDLLRYPALEYFYIKLSTRIELGIQKIDYRSIVLNE